jgi:hypothetical protein
MTRTEKLYRRLDDLERELKLFLIEALSEIEKTGFAWVFDSPELKPFLNTWWFKRKPLRHLLDLVSEIENLRNKLGEPLGVGIVGLYHKYIREFNNKENEQRLGPRKMAASFLQEIKDQLR